MYKIADFYIKILGVFNDPFWGKFKSENKKINLEIQIEQSSSTYYGMEKCDIDLEYSQCFLYVYLFMFVNSKWDKLKIFNTGCLEEISAFLIQTFNSYVTFNKMLHMHSSLIKWKQFGLMFLGPSGIGKTTQAELWHKYRDALIINGDVVFVQETGDCFLGWGTPWHGSSPYCENTSVPVEALVVLKQAPENSIRELSGFEKVTAVSNSVFYPRWLENGMELCLETLDHLLSALPVYELSCRPDEEAVRLTEEAVFGRG